MLSRVLFVGGVELICKVDTLGTNPLAAPRGISGLSSLMQGRGGSQSRA